MFQHWVKEQICLEENSSWTKLEEYTFFGGMFCFVLFLSFCFFVCLFVCLLFIFDEKLLRLENALGKTET